MEEIKNKSATKPVQVTQVILIIILTLVVIPFLIPLVLVIAISFSSEASIAQHGYQFFPSEFSFEAYRYLFVNGANIFRAFAVSVIVTVAGVFLSVTLITLYAYPLAHKDFYYKKFFTFFIFFTMLFSGGLVPSYLVMTKLLYLQNTLLALIIPLAFNAFFVIVLRTFFQSLPMSVLESGRIDGASEWTILFRLVLPMSVPGIATVGIFMAVGYWNDWFQALLYIRDENLLPLQALLQRIQSNMEMLAKSADISRLSDVTKLPQESARMAIVILTTLPIILSYPFFQKYFVSGLTVGSIKE